MDLDSSTTTPSVTVLGDYGYASGPQPPITPTPAASSLAKSTLPTSSPATPTPAKSDPAVPAPAILNPATPTLAATRPLEPWNDGEERELTSLARSNPWPSVDFEQLLAGTTDLANSKAEMDFGLTSKNESLARGVKPREDGIAESLYDAPLPNLFAGWSADAIDQVLLELARIPGLQDANTMASQFFDNPEGMHPSSFTMNHWEADGARQSAHLPDTHATSLFPDNINRDNDGLGWMQEDIDFLPYDVPVEADLDGKWEGRTLFF